MGLYRPSRRAIFRGVLAAGGIGISGAKVSAQELPATPQCGAEGTATPPQTEGPFFRAGSPGRADLVEPGSNARQVELVGFVLTRGCNPVARAVVDMWHADDRGDYDERGFRFRGHVYADAEGRYRFRTIVPAVYPGRTRHYHVKVQAPGRPVLTTQLYFPDEPANRRDGLFRRELLMRVADGGAAARFDFVLDLA